MVSAEAASLAAYSSGPVRLGDTNRTANSCCLEFGVLGTKSGLLPLHEWRARGAQDEQATSLLQKVSADAAD